MDASELPSDPSARRRVLAPSLEPDVTCAAAIGVPVLITADTDVAEWIARLIHDRSERREEAFVVYHPGNGDQLGLLKRLMNGSGPGRGTVFVADVARATREVQEWLRDKLAASQLEPQAPFRVIAGTPAWLFEQVVEGEFDEALFYRLNTIHIRVRTYETALQPDEKLGQRLDVSPGAPSMDVAAFRKHRMMLRAGYAPLPAQPVPAFRHR